MWVMFWCHIHIYAPYPCCLHRPVCCRVWVQVLCLAMRAVCALWQEQGAGHPLVHLLRQQQQLWAGLEGCITRGAPLGEWEPADDAWLQLAEAYAWQVVMLEAYACPRNAPGAGAGGPGTPSAATALVPAPADNAAGAAGRAGAAGSKVWEVVDRVVGKGVIAKVGRQLPSALLCVCCFDRCVWLMPPWAPEEGRTLWAGHVLIP